MSLFDMISRQRRSTRDRDKRLRSSSRTIPNLLQPVVSKAGERLALVDAGGACTYRHLERWANGIAHADAVRNARTGERACILTESGSASMAAFLGLCKAGMMSVRLNSDQPLSYLRAIMSDAEPAMILTTREHRALAESLCSGGVDIVDLDGDCGGLDTPPAWQPSPDDRTGITYTSGSTGQPKGVVHTHRSTLAFVENYLLRTGLTPRDRVALLHDTRALDALAALSVGATVYHFPLARQGFQGLADWLAENHITVLPTVPSVLRYLVRGIPDGTGLKVRLLRLSGEMLSADDVRRAAKVFPASCRVLNWFGSTEIAVASRLFSFHDIDDVSAIPAGEPFPGLEVQLVDTRTSRSATTGAGEIVVSGASLFDGYWKRSDLDEERLSPHPEKTGYRRFRTGDIGYFDPSGQLVVVGRADDQVKVNGYRVEPLEVEAALRLVPGIRDALVQLISEDGNNGNPRNVLAAYVVAEKGEPPPVRTIRRLLASRIPRHMIPTYFARIDAVPKLPGGKPDRTSLPELVAVTRQDYNLVATNDLRANAPLENEASSD